MLFKNIKTEDFILTLLWISQILIYFIHFGLGYSFNVDVLFIYGVLKFIYKLAYSFPGIFIQLMKVSNLRQELPLAFTIAWYGLFYVLIAFAMVQVLVGKNGIIHLI